jgi:hypothetical protein
MASGTVASLIRTRQAGSLRLACAIVGCDVVNGQGNLVSGLRQVRVAAAEEQQVLPLSLRLLKWQLQRPLPVRVAYGP